MQMFRTFFCATRYIVCLCHGHRQILPSSHSSSAHVPLHKKNHCHLWVGGRDIFWGGQPL